MSEVMTGNDAAVMLGVILNKLDSIKRKIIEEQDRLIAERSGTPPLAVKSMHRSGDRKAA